jgi:hypothetical protein
MGEGVGGMSIKVQYTYTCERCGKFVVGDGPQGRILDSIAVVTMLNDDTHNQDFTAKTLREGLCDNCRRAIYFKCKGIIESEVQL